MLPNYVTCDICYNNVENYYCKLKCCGNNFCLPCIFKWFYNNFSCPNDRTTKIGFVIYNIHNNHVLYNIDNMESFTALQANLKLDVNLMNQEYFYEIINNRPAMFIVKFKGNALMTNNDVHTMFKAYGIVANVIIIPESYIVNFYDINPLMIPFMIRGVKFCCSISIYNNT